MDEINGEVGWQQVLDLVTRLDQSGLEEASVSFGNVSVKVSRNGSLAPEIDSAVVVESSPRAESHGSSNQPQSKATSVTMNAEGTPIAAPMVGVFFRSPAPGAAPFVTEGQVIKADQTIGIIEVMKMMNPVVAGVAGTVLSFAIEDAQPVQFGEPLLYVNEEL